MTTLITLLQAAAPASGQQSGGGWSFWLMIILMFVIMYFFMIRPQRKQQKFRNELKKGDKVITAGGIYGTIGEIEEKTVLLKVDGDVKIRVDKGSIVRDPSDNVQK